MFTVTASRYKKHVKAIRKLFREEDRLRALVYDAASSKVKRQFDNLSVAAMTIAACAMKPESIHALTEYMRKNMKPSCTKPKVS